MHADRYAAYLFHRHDIVVLWGIAAVFIGTLAYGWIYNNLMLGLVLGLLVLGGCKAGQRQQPVAEARDTVGASARQEETRMWMTIGERRFAVTLAGIGLLIGQSLIFGARAAFPQFMGEAAVPLWAVAVSVLVSAATGVISGMLPAIKAARLDPIDALRHE